VGVGLLPPVLAPAVVAALFPQVPFFPDPPSLTIPRDAPRPLGLRQCEPRRPDCARAQGATSQVRL